MHSVFSKTLLACLLSLILVGQSMASVAMVYKMTSMQAMQMSATERAQSSSQSATMSHCDEMAMTNPTDNTLNSMSEKSHTDSEKCCTQDCQCLTSGCSTASAIFNFNYNHTAPANNTKILTKPSLVLTRTAQSLYRPPIKV